MKDIRTIRRPTVATLNRPVAKVLVSMSIALICAITPLPVPVTLDLRTIGQKRHRMVTADEHH